MFRAKVGIFQSAVRQCRHMSSANSAASASQPPKSYVGRTIQFVTKNRQQLLNIFAVYLVLSFGVHNLKVKNAWQEIQSELEQLRNENKAIKSALEDEKWLQDVEQKVRNGRTGQNILQTEVQSRIATCIVGAEDSSAVEIRSSDRNYGSNVSDGSLPDSKKEVGIVLDKGRSNSERVI